MSTSSSFFTVALVGNPNSGKSTLFNNLTGGTQHVGNYPGVTVEKKEGVCVHEGVTLQVVDLPGIYSLTAYSIEELVARDFLLEERPQVVVNVIDASNLERNLYLTVQLLELGLPLVLAFNMSDQARVRGIEFDLTKLSRFLGVPIIPTVGHRRVGMRELLDAVMAVARVPPRPLLPQVDYGREIEQAIAILMTRLESHPELADTRRRRWVALKLLENDAEVSRRFASEDLAALVQAQREHLRKVLGDEPEVLLGDRRYGFISGACQEAVRRSVETRHTWSDRIDEVATHPVIGIPIFLVLMYMTFWLTFSVGRYPMGWLEHAFATLGRWIGQLWPVGSQSLIRSLLVDGILAGVGGVLTFLPNILLLFLAIALLEDSGYMARAAFIADRFMHRLGLHGKSFIPMLIGFGCTVPAILAARVLDTRRDRLTTILVLPLISCGARLPIYALLVPAFFPPALHAPMMWMFYLLGILLAAAGARLLRATVLRGETVPLVMDLPPYRMPTLRGLWLHMWERGGAYLRKAGTVILAFSIALWALNTFPRVTPPPELTPSQQAAYRLEHSSAGRLGRALEPVLRPLGFDWRIGTAILGAMAAKEIFVSQMGILFAVDEKEAELHPLRERLRATYTPLTAFCVMLFLLIGSPCAATVVVAARESGAWKWAALQWGGLTALAYLLTAAVYQAGHWIGLG